MKTRTMIATVSACAVLLLLAVADVQAQGKGSGGQAKQQRPTHAQEMHSHEMMHKQPESKHMAQMQLRSQLKDEDMYGHEMMTAEERDRYRMQLNAAGSDREWAQLRAEHQEAMRQRAEAQSRALEAPVYGQHMMTPEEQKQFTERMQAAKTEAERAEVREQHRETINARAKELGIEPEKPKR